MHSLGKTVFAGNFRAVEAAAAADENTAGKTGSRSPLCNSKETFFNRLAF